jgi:NAD(P)H-flavin reductase
MNFFFQVGLLRERLTSLVPLLGVLCLSLLTVLASSSLSRVRRWSYRVFFIFHLTIAISILPVLFFHASPLRLYTLESLAIFLFDILAKKLDTVTAFTTVTAVPHTKLIKLSVPIPLSKIYRFKMSPGQHVYLSIPPQSRPNKNSIFSIHDLLYNPFTVADVTTSEITLVLRTLHGPTTAALRKLTKLSKAKPPINIEGPYGASRHFPNFTEEFDRVLLVAGGVGATFILPIYHKIQQSLEQDGVRCGSSVELIWAMRSAAEAMWAMKGENLNSLNEDEHVRVYVTNDGTSDPRCLTPPLEDGSIEMEDLRTVEQPIRVSGGYQRPNLKKIVDEVFRHGVEDRVAVIVCGPVGMAEELRGHVGRWVQLGRYVWWHDESFGW